MMFYLDGYLYGLHWWKEKFGEHLMIAITTNITATADNLVSTGTPSKDVLNTPTMHIVSTYNGLPQCNADCVLPTGAAVTLQCNAVTDAITWILTNSGWQIAVTDGTTTKTANGGF
jgi:hypothetical protein